MQKANPQFVLQLDASEIRRLAGEYDIALDTEALEAGKRIARGELRRVDFETIVDWKSSRARSHFVRNTDEEIFEAAQFATIARSDRNAVAIFMGLEGVGVAMASALLAAINPDRYTIIDFRALETLGARESNVTISYYLHYLTECRRLAALRGIDLRTLDRALWQRSRNSSKRSN